MLLTVLGTLAGSAGAVYILLKYVFPNVWLDYLYKRKQSRAGNAIKAQFAKKNLLIDIFEEKALDRPDKTFIIFRDEKYTYRQMERLANQACQAALEIGLKQGDIVALMIYNEPAFIWTYLGFMKAGIQMSLINFNLRSASLSHCINVSGAKAIIIGQGQELMDAVEAVLGDIPKIPIYLQGSDEEQVVGSPYKSFKSIMSRTNTKRPEKSIRSKVGLYTPNIYIYTSGTTGLPKPAIVVQMRSLVAGFTWDSFGMSEDDVVYQTLPLYHSAGLMVGFANVITKGATMVLRDKFSASLFWEDCRKHDVTLIQYIGEICRYLVARPKSENDGVNKIKYAFGNGLRADIWAEFQTRFNIPNIIEFYGATECPIGFANLSNKFGSCGRSSPYMRQTNPAAFVKFDLNTEQPVRDKHGRCVPIQADEVGLLIVPLQAGKSSFQGYKGKKEFTDKKILRDVFKEGDSYFNTGDLMRVDKEYYLYFNDRVGDTFRWKGENVSTTEVSNILSQLSFIHDASVFGVSVSGGDGKVGMASLHLNDQRAVGLSPKMLQDLSKHCQEALPPYARPRFIRVQKEFALTSTFKQQKMDLVREGFDVTKVPDPLYYLNLTTNMYQPLDVIIYTQIIAGKVPL